MECFLLYFSIYDTKYRRTVLKIRLKDEHVIIEIPTYSQHFDTIKHSLEKLKSDITKKENFLKSIYFLCAKNANYHDIDFYKKLIKASHKDIKIKALSDSSLNQYYTILGVSKDDSMSIVRKKYLKLAKAYHPDNVSYINSSLVKKYTHKFQKIQQAYEILKLQNVS